MRITIGKENCVNDTIILIDNTLPNIIKNLGNDYADINYNAMKKEIERLKLVTKDLEDMVYELSENKNDE